MLTSRSWTLTLLMAFNQRTLDGENGNGGPASWNLGYMDLEKQYLRFHCILFFGLTELQSKQEWYLWSFNDPFSAGGSFFKPRSTSGDILCISCSLTVECPLAKRCPFVHGCPLVDGCKPVLWKEWKDSSSSDPPVLSWPVSLSWELVWLKFPDDPKRLLSTGLHDNRGKHSKSEWVKTYFHIFLFFMLSHQKKSSSRNSCR